MDLNDVYKLYRNAGDGVYKPYPIKPEIRAKLDRHFPGAQVVYPRRLRSFSWAAVVLRVSAVLLVAYVAFLIVS